MTDTGRGRPRHDIVQFTLEIGKVQMTVAIDEH
jgi:hypothetical protein